MVLLRAIVACALVGFHSVAVAGLRSLRSRQSGDQVFDGEYLLGANANNMLSEWWYLQALAEPVGDNPPANVVVVYEQGYIFGVAPAAESLEPEYYVTVSGTSPNGTNFYFTINATSLNVTTSGEAVTGVWGGAGNFTLSSDLQTLTAYIDAPDVGITGSLTLQSKAPHHYPCGSAADPYFDSAAPAGVQLNSYEQILFDQFGWVVTIPAGAATVSLDIEGVPIVFAGNAYHDHNFMPTTVNEFGETWYWSQAQVGPYALTGVLLQALDSELIITAGYLARDGEILQNQCGLNGTRAANANTVTPWGASLDPLTLAVVPQGFFLEYTLDDGSQYAFNLTSLNTNPDMAIYYRWTGTATGGEVGGEQYSGTTLFEWMNPGLTTYTPS